MFYNPRSHMAGSSLTASMRPLVVILLLICAWTAVTRPSHAQQGAAASDLHPERAMWATLAHGKRSDAERLARARPAGDPAAAAMLGRLAIDSGKYDEAVKRLEPAAAKAPLSDAALELGLLHQRLGREEAATRLLAPIFNQGGGSADHEATLRAGRAAQALRRAREANSLYRAASNAGGNPAADTAWGLLFLEKYEPAEALRSFQQALAQDAQWAPAHAGVARAVAEEDPAAAAAAAERALAIDPNLADAHLMLAELDLDNSRNADARKRIDAVLAFNPSHLDARALLAAMAYVVGDASGFESELRRVLEINPVSGEGYRMAAELAARNYRFEEAVALTDKAVTLDPTNARAHADMGMHLMRTGDEAGARRALDRAFRSDPYDKVTYNLLTLLDKLDQFVVIREGDIVLKLHPDEAAVMREYALPLAQDALKTMTERYKFNTASERSNVTCWHDRRRPTHARGRRCACRHH